MSVDLIPPDQLRRAYAKHLRIIDERIENPKQETIYRLQISLILDRIRIMKEVDTSYVKLDESQQEIIKQLLEKEMHNGND